MKQNPNKVCFEQLLEKEAKRSARARPQLTINSHKETQFLELIRLRLKHIHKAIDVDIDKL